MSDVTIDRKMGDTQSTDADSVAALVQCTDAKRDGRTIAWQLYDTTLFRKSWTTASLCGDPYVISSKHELVPPTESLDSYDDDLREKCMEERYEWGRAVVHQLPDHYDTVVVFGGRAYADPIRTVITDNVEYEATFYDPYRFTSGNGQQMRVADRLAEQLLDGESLDDAIQYATAEYRP